MDNQYLPRNNRAKARSPGVGQRSCGLLTYAGTNQIGDDHANLPSASVKRT